MDPRTSAARPTTSKPLTLTVPASGLSKVDRIRTTVVLPAPLEPSRAKMLPRATSKSTPRSTCSSLYDFSRPRTWIAGPPTRSVVIWSMDMAPACGVDAASRSSPSSATQKAAEAGERAADERGTGQHHDQAHQVLQV